MINMENVPKSAKIAVAFSSGVDSSTTLALLKEAGYSNLFAITLLFHGDASKTNTQEQQIIADCIKITQKINIPMHFLNITELFQTKVMNPYINASMEGTRLNPCAICNRKIKFGHLLSQAKKLGADFLVTGHYINWKYNEKTQIGEIYCGDATRDQSYFLSQIHKDALNNIRFPLANFTKETTRLHAKRLNLHVANKKASNDLCFLGSDLYKSLLDDAKKNVIYGNFIDINNNIIKKHSGIHNYTIGQRKGLNIGGTAVPYFVVKIDATTGNITVAPKEYLQNTSITIKNINWIAENPFPTEEFKMLVKLRSTQPLIWADITPLSKTSANVTFQHATYSVSKGQICAIYNENHRLMGGGTII